jgi:hypothetical protein
VICWSLDNESCAQEESRLRGFYDCDAVETCGNTSEGVEATTAFDFPDRPPFLASLFAFSLALRASLSAWNKCPLWIEFIPINDSLHGKVC